MSTGVRQRTRSTSAATSVPISGAERTDHVSQQSNKRCLARMAPADSPVFGDSQQVSPLTPTSQTPTPYPVGTLPGPQRYTSALSV
jgi:hypothetical protein